MSGLRLCALLLLFGVAAEAWGQEAPGHAGGKVDRPGHATGTASDSDGRATGASDTGVSAEALFAENARLKRQVELLNKMVEVLQLRIRTLEGEQ
jgi:hypothetical protein